jgi:protein SCO1/2
VISSTECARKESAAVAFLALLAFYFIGGCQITGNLKEYHLEGLVLSKDMRNQQITVSHGEIAGLMPAMTMDYKLRDSGALKDLERGDKIKADLFMQDNGTDYWLEDVKITDRSRRGAVLDGPTHLLEVGESIPDISMLDQDGKSIRLGQFKGKALLITFIYTRCPLATFCPRITSQFAAIHDQLSKSPDDARKTHLLSISFDPEYDKPEILRKYGLAYMNDSSGFATWSFASPNPQDLRELADAFGLQYFQEENQIVHSVVTVLVSPNGAVSKVWPDNEWKTSEVLQAVLAEAHRAGSADVGEGKESPTKKMPSATRIAKKGGS